MTEASDKHTLTVGEVKHLLLLFREGMVTEAENRYGTIGAINWAKGLDQYLGSFGAYIDAIAVDATKEQESEQ